MAIPVFLVVVCTAVAADSCMTELRLVSERGHYLAPYARILLAIAEIREKNPAGARPLLSQLHEEFPGNTLFAQELARLDRRAR